MAPIFWHLKTVVFEYEPFSAVLLCLLLALVYVGSLYIWTTGTEARDHPQTIKRRFIRVGVVCLLTIPFLWMISSTSHSVKARDLFSLLGLRLRGCIPALVLPLVLTMILFAGPLSLHYMDGIFTIYSNPNYWLNNIKNVLWIRNHVVAPLSEEFTFRACMLPLLVPAVGETTAVLVCPLFFGVAHFHHVYEKVKTGTPTKQAVLQALFQFGYTSIFGAYSAFLFLRTGHLVAPVIAHAFCNHMGFPDFQEVMGHKPPRRYYVMAAFALGLISWYLLLYPLTTPWVFANDLYDI